MKVQDLLEGTKRELFTPAFERKSFFFHLFEEKPKPDLEPWEGLLSCSVSALISAETPEKSWIRPHQERNFTKMRREYKVALKKRRCNEECLKHGDSGSVSESDSD